MLKVSSTSANYRQGGLVQSKICIFFIPIFEMVNFIMKKWLKIIFDFLFEKKRTEENIFQKKKGGIRENKTSNIKLVYSKLV